MSNPADTNPETIVLKSFLNFREEGDIRPLTNDESQVFMTLLMAEQEAEKEPGGLKPFDRQNMDNNRRPDVLKEMASGFGFRVFAARMHPTTQLSQELFIFLLTTMKSPGEAVMWCYTLHRMFQAEQKLLTIGDWANEFPMGLPTREAMSKCWDYQKGGTHGLQTDNLIDQGDYWK
jgi:hypothetical protein